MPDVDVVMICQAHDRADTENIVLRGFSFSAAGIPDNALRLDAHALAGLYSCKIRTFDGYIQALNPNLT